MNYKNTLMTFGSIFNNKLIIIILLVSLGIASCRKLVSDDFPDFPKVPVINSILVADSLLKVHISLTDKIGDEKLSFIDNAQVIVTTNNNEFDTLFYDGNSIYQSKTIVQPLKNYSCHVTIPGYQSISCDNNIPETPEILAIQHINYAGRDAEGATYPAVKITFKNNPAENLYFQIAIKLMMNDYVEFVQILNITDPVLLNEGIPLTVFSNELIESDSYTMTINYTSGNYTSNGNGWNTELYPLVIELRAITYDYYMYLKQLYLYETGRYPTDVGGGAVTNFNLYSNIPGGYGIFAGYSWVVSDTIVPEPYN
jgi:hypothetical protein